MGPILLTSYSGALGGAERILLDMAGALDGETLLACPDGPLAGAARAAGLRVFVLRERSLHLRGSPRVGLTALAELAAHGCEVRRLIEAVEPRLVVAWGMRSAIACLLGPRADVPTVFQHNDLLPGPVVGRIVRLAAARAELVLTLSRTIAADLDPHATLEGRLQHVYPGVDLGAFDPQVTPARPPEVVMLGALVEWKRPELGLEALALARRRCPELRLRVVGGELPGDGERLSGSLRARAAQPDLIGAVELVGPVADPSRELERATCLLHCAPREPFGLVVLEALAAGRPAVVPRAGGPAEIVDDTCGRLYAPGDAAGAAAALVELASEPELAAALGAAGRRRVSERFALAARAADWARAVQRAGPPPVPAADAGGLAIVTVTHNSARVLPRLLGSVARHLPGAQMVVVDSGSADRSLAIARAHAGATVIDLGTNAGFARGCNAGLREVAEPVTALLNPDVELIDDSLAALAALAARALDPHAPERLLAPLVLDGNGRRQDSVHPLPTSPADLLRALLPPGAVPRPLARWLDPWRAGAPRRVGWAVGCALVARTDTLRALGPFDPRFFLYGEDLDLALRAAPRGIETWFWPHCRVIHHRAHATQPAFGGEPFQRLARARRAAVREGLGSRRARLDDAAQALTFVSRGALKRIARRSALRERRQLEALAAVRRDAGG